MSFGDAIRTCLSKYVDFGGRASRPEYWWFVLFVLAGAMVLDLVSAALSGLFQLGTLLPLLAAGFRRMQDTGRPGWLVLIPFAITLGGLLFGMLGMLTIGGPAMMGPGGPEAAAGFMAGLGMAGLFLTATLQLVALGLLVWWLTRPGEPGPNAWGAPPER